MGESYKPPFTMNEEITNLIVEIGEYVGAITTYDAMRPNPILRRENRIKTIHSSLAIEQNTLTLEQVTDVINGKRILGPPQDIREVKNAYAAYERVSVLDPYSVKNLLLAHKIMMEGLVKEVGNFRSGNVGVYAGTELIHAAPPCGQIVPSPGGSVIITANPQPLGIRSTCPIFRISLRNPFKLLIALTVVPYLCASSQRVSPERTTYSK